MTIHTETPNRVDLAYRHATRLYGTIILGPTVALVFFAPVVLRLLADERYSANASLMPIIAIGAMTSGLVTQLSRPTEMKKRYGVMSTISMGAAAINLVVTIALLPAIGLLGAAIGTLAAYLAAAIAYLVIDRASVRGLPWAHYAWLGGVSAALAWFISSTLDGLLGLVVFGCLYAGISLPMMRRSRLVG